MIETLRVRDFALVDELSLDLAAGFSVLTGETGAGKSILLQALGLVLGDRASRDLVRAGASQARVEGLFGPRGRARSAIAGLLQEAGVPWEEDSLLIVRTVTADGRSRAHVNGVLVPLALLESIGTHLVEVSSQHQHQGLLREETHLALLDSMLDAAGVDARAAYSGAHGDWRAAETELARLEVLEARSRERADFLRFQADEIRAASLVPGEDQALLAERDLLLHGEKLRQAYGRAETEIYSGSEAALDRIGRALREVDGATRNDPRAEEIRDLLAQAKSCIEEAALQLRDRVGALDTDPKRLEAVEDRLEVIRRLLRKHGGGAAEVLGKLAELEAELWELENMEVALDRARERCGEARAAVREWATALREARQRAAAELERRTGTELEALAMGRASFRVALEEAEPGPEGGDAVRFLLAPNPGEPPRPMARIASGGELSRIMLALKNGLRDGAVETLIFDEVDAGIGGTVADTVGQRLEALAASCQVVCITHLPQIASRARNHLRVEKAVTNGRTVTRVIPLEAGERIEELARLLGGRHVTDTTRAHAREMVERHAP